MDLPINVMDQIMSLIPVRDAAKMSLLSTEWRDRWRTIPSLSFSSADGSSAGKFAREVDQVLLLYLGMIRSFRIHHKTAGLSADDIEVWIHHLSNGHQIENLEIVVSQFDTWTMPSDFFSWKNLARLELAKCLLKPLKTFRGFPKLKSLRLATVSVAPAVLQTLISGSPALEALSLVNIDGINDGFVVDSPSLKSFAFNCNEYVAVKLVNCPDLEEFFFNVSDKAKRDTVSVRNNNNLAELIANAPRLRVLRITGFSLEYLFSEAAPRVFQTQLADVRHLSIDVRFGSHNYAKALYTLLSCVPNLQELHVRCFSYWASDESDRSDHHEWEMWRWEGAFPHLRKIVVQYVNDQSWGPENITFFELMLSASPILDLMAIKMTPLAFPSFSRISEFTNRLTQLVHASPNAKISVSQ